MPKRSPTITTSPLAIIVPLARISSASPAKAVELDHRAFVETQQIADLDLSLSNLDCQGNVDIFQKTHVLGADTLGGGSIHCRFGYLGFVRHRPFLSRHAPLFQAGLQIDRGARADLAKFAEEGIFAIDLHFDAFPDGYREGIANLHIDQLVH